MLVTSRTSSWVVPPTKVVFYKEVPGAYAAKGCIARARSVLPERPSETSFPEDVARQAASFAFGRVETKELAADHAVAGGAQYGRLLESA